MHQAQVINVRSLQCLRQLKASIWSCSLAPVIIFGTFSRHCRQISFLYEFFNFNFSNKVIAWHLVTCRKSFFERHKDFLHFDTCRNYLLTLWDRADAKAFRDVFTSQTKLFLTSNLCWKNISAFRSTTSKWLLALGNVLLLIFFFFNSDSCMQISFSEHKTQPQQSEKSICHYSFPINVLLCTYLFSCIDKFKLSLVIVNRIRMIYFTFW